MGSPLVYKHVCACGIGINAFFISTTGMASRRSVPVTRFRMSKLSAGSTFTRCLGSPCVARLRRNDPGRTVVWETAQGRSRRTRHTGSLNQKAWAFHPTLVMESIQDRPSPSFASRRVWACPQQFSSQADGGRSPRG